MNFSLTYHHFTIYDLDKESIEQKMSSFDDKFYLIIIHFKQYRIVGNKKNLCSSFWQQSIMIVIDTNKWDDNVGYLKYLMDTNDWFWDEICHRLELFNIHEQTHA